MKKLFFISSVLVLLMGCSNLDTQVDEQNVRSNEVPSVVYNGNVCVAISEGAPFATKAEDAVYYTLVGEDGETVYTLVIESSDAEDDLVFCKHYSEQGDLIATFVYAQDDLLDIEITSEYEMTKGERFQKYKECVKETYSEMRENVQRGHELQCDFNVTMCDAISAVAAVVSCTGSSDDNSSNQPAANQPAN